MSTAGSFVFFSNQGSCSKKTTFDVTIEESISSLLDTSLCEGDTIFYQGLAITDSGQYVFVDTLSRCGNTTFLNVSINNFIQSRVDTIICLGDSVVYQGEVMNSTGSYVFLEMDGNCTLKKTYAIDVYSPQQITIDTALCKGDTLVIRNQTILGPGNYSFTFGPLQDCPSTETYQVSWLNSEQCLTSISPGLAPLKINSLAEFISLYSKWRNHRFSTPIFRFLWAIDRGI